MNSQETAKYSAAPGLKGNLGLASALAVPQLGSDLPATIEI